MSDIRAVEAGDFISLSWKESIQAGWHAYLVKCSVSIGYCPPEQTFLPNVTSALFKSQSPGALWTFSVLTVGYADQTTDSILQVNFTESKSCS